MPFKVSIRRTVNRLLFLIHVFAAGTARDVSFLIDFLPSYLFPRDERTIVEWVVAGISLGGHSTWIALKNGTSTLLLHLRSKRPGAQTSFVRRSTRQDRHSRHRVPRLPRPPRIACRTRRSHSHPALCPRLSPLHHTARGPCSCVHPRFRSFCEPFPR